VFSFVEVKASGAGAAWCGVCVALIVVNEKEGEKSMRTLRDGHLVCSESEQ
jgi:hypothetical protein